jgi:probable F420-dependent oxidoreductase
MILCIRAIWDCWQNGTKPRFEGTHYRFTLMTPFFSPGPIEWPRIPIYIAGVNPYVSRLAGELCDGFLVHPFHSIKYLRDVVFPNAEQGLATSGRTRADLTYTTTAFVITGRSRDELERNRGAVRQQIAFYASTRTYIGVLESHGWGETCIRLNEKAAKGDWTGMASLITDEMLQVYAVEGLVDDIPGLIKKKYTGVLDRLGFYALPGALGDEAQRRALVAACKQ